MLDRETSEKHFLDAFEAHSDSIFRYCYYRVFDEEKAKDFVQETFCRTWQYLADGKAIDNIKAFLYRVANNVIIDESRKKKSVSLDQIMENGFTPKMDGRQATETYFEHKEVMEVIGSLDEKYRDVIIMKYVDGLSTKEIAEATGENESNVYVRIHRGLGQVKEIFKKLH